MVSHQASQSSSEPVSQSALAGFVTVRHGKASSSQSVIKPASQPVSQYSRASSPCAMARPHPASQSSSRPASQSVLAGFVTLRHGKAHSSSQSVSQSASQSVSHQASQPASQYSRACSTCAHAVHVPYMCMPYMCRTCTDLHTYGLACPCTCATRHEHTYMHMHMHMHMHMRDLRADVHAPRPGARCTCVACTRDTL